MDVFGLWQKVQNGQQICRQLKKDDLVRASKGTITLVLDVVYNQVRMKQNMLDVCDAYRINECNNLPCRLFIRDSISLLSFPDQGRCQKFPANGGKIHGGNPKIRQESELSHT